ncbi:ABC transporter permease [Kiloniella majae]|uniref:ABC transporter permease n=1 Tax=Kiloniella majae TaxID=1938558 RepID=UPI000A277520|nr:ABC transporter permease [Kiloniella majae]
MTKNSDVPLIKIIEAHQPWWRLNLADAYDKREICYVFAWRKISTLYKQKALGIVWGLIEPLALLIIMTAVFGYVMRLPTNGYPYPVYAFAGLMPWLLFSKATTSVSNSLMENMAVISKVYFPRLIIPVSSLAKDIFDSVMSMAVLLSLVVYYGFPLSAKYLLLPFFMGIPIFAALGIGLWVSAPMVRFRDLQHVVAICLQVGMYASPIIYSAKMVPENLLPYYTLNPMSWAIDGVRWIMLDQPLEFTISFYLSMALTLAVFISGLFIFSIFEKLSVDVQ